MTGEVTGFDLGVFVYVGYLTLCAWVSWLCLANYYDEQLVLEKDMIDFKLWVEN